MKEKTMVLVEFTGREVNTGRVFDTTSEKTAKEAQLYRENAIFKPIPVVIGNGDLLKGLDDALKEMKEKETKTIKLSPQEAFGERKPELIVVVPLQEFRNRKIQPVPGLVVDLNGQYGKVQTVSGGRVRVDFNNDLAGKEVEYEITINREVKDVNEKVALMTEKFFPLKKEKAIPKLEKDVLKLKLPKELAQQIAPLIEPFSKVIKETIPEIKKVEIVESFETKKEEKEVKEKKEVK